MILIRRVPKIVEHVSRFVSDLKVGVVGTNVVFRSLEMEQLRGRGNCIGVVFLKVRFLFTASFHTFLRNFVYLSVAKYSLFNILSNRRCPSKRCTRRKEKKGKRKKERNPRRNFSIEANV